MSLGGTSSHGLLSLSNQVVDIADFNAIKISIADPDKIRSWYLTRPVSDRKDLQRVRQRMHCGHRDSSGTPLSHRSRPGHCR